MRGEWKTKRSSIKTRSTDESRRAEQLLTLKILKLPRAPEGAEILLPPQTSHFYEPETEKREYLRGDDFLIFTASPTLAWILGGGSGPPSPSAVIKLWPVLWESRRTFIPPSPLCRHACALATHHLPIIPLSSRPCHCSVWQRQGLNKDRIEGSCYLKCRNSGWDFLLISSG